MERQKCLQFERPSKHSIMSNIYQNTNADYRASSNVAKMKVLKLVLFLIIALSDLNLANCSQMLVENGIYSRVTVQIEPQPQPANCVEFLDKLEVRLNTL